MCIRDRPVEEAQVQVVEGGTREAGIRVSSSSSSSSSSSNSSCSSSSSSSSNGILHQGDKRGCVLDVIGRERVSCDVPVWVAGPDVGTAGDDVGSLAVASPLLPPPAPLATSAWSASISARSFCSSTFLRRTSISAFSSCISFSLSLSLLSLSLSLSLC